MMRTRNLDSQRGAALLELAICATVFLTALFGVLEFGRLLWTHNALKDAARRGARYAAVRKEADEAAVVKYIVYGDPNANPATAKPVVEGLTTSNVNVDYANFNGILLSARATVKITNYKYKFALPLVGTTLTMPSYKTSIPGESAGFIPCNVTSATPAAPCPITPSFP